LKKAIGDIEMAKVLRDGSLLVKCKNIEQKNKTMKLQSVCKKEIVEKKVIGEKGGVKGVITGIPVEENLEELRKVIKGGMITEITRLQAFRNGEKTDSESVLLHFKDDVLPMKVMVGYMSFNIREYVPPPLRCYKCQRYGHTANDAKGNRDVVDVEENMHMESVGVMLQ